MLSLKRTKQKAALHYLPPEQKALNPETITRNYRTWLEGRGSPITALRWSQTARDFLTCLWRWKRPKRPEDFTKEDIQKYMAELKRRKGRNGEAYKDSTRATAASICLSLYRFLKVPKKVWEKESWERGDLPRGDSADRPQPTYTFDEMNSILEAARGNKRDYAWHRIWMGHMPRRHEIHLLKAKDFFFDDNAKAYMLFIPTAKHGIQTNVLLDEDTAKAILDYLSTREITDENQPLFAEENGKPIGDSELNKVHKRYCTAAGVKCKGLHAGRRGLTTWLDDQGMKRSDIKAVGRWKSDSMPGRYIQRDRRESLERFRGIHPFFAGEAPKVITPSIPTKITRAKMNPKKGEPSTPHPKTKLKPPPADVAVPKKPVKKKVVDWMEQFV